MSANTQAVNGTATNGTHNAAHQATSVFVSPQEFAERNHDYIITGGGTAGLVVAARLTENPNIKVGVIEAGKNKLNDMFVDTPGLFTHMFGNPDYDWHFKTTPQVGNTNGSVHHVVRGKMLGGSSGINYMVYVRGSDADYDDWAAIVEDPKWSASELKHYMRKHQTVEPKADSIKDRATMPLVSENHGTSGPVKTGFSSTVMGLEDDVIEACDIASGYNKKPIDPWSGDHIGFYHTLATIARTGPHKGKRHYAARAYLEPILNRPNLCVITESLVTRIDLDGDRATGVTYEHGGQTFSAKAKREIIMAGGAIGTPHILELSGIGDPAVLSKAGVECKIENKDVGENLQDHVGVPICYQTNGIDTIDSMARPEVIQSAMQAYQETQDGPIANAATVQGFFPFTLTATTDEQAATIKSIADIKEQTPFAKKQRETIITHLKGDQSANLQMMSIAATINTTDSHADQSKIVQPLPHPNAPNGVTMLVGVQYPVSRGSVHITSSDPHVQPAIDPGYLTHEADLDVLAAALKFGAKAFETEPLKSKVTQRLWPEPDLDLTKTEDCKKAVMAFYLSVYHLCGSVAMGAALDSRLKLKGAQNIRVVDASVFPGHISGNIVSTVYTVGERAADIIKEDWDHASQKEGIAA